MLFKINKMILQSDEFDRIETEKKYDEIYEKHISDIIKNIENPEKKYSLWLTIED
jgi:hypothetical protein